MSTRLKNIEDTIKCLKKKNKRITPQLLEVLRIINCDLNHFSVSDIYNEARKTFPSISLNTVYSILKKLHGMGEIQKIITLGKETNYCPSSNLHQHVICNKCKTVDDVELESVDFDSINRNLKTDYKIKGFSILFNGVCKQCRNGKGKNFEKIKGEFNEI